MLRGRNDERERSPSSSSLYPTFAHRVEVRDHVRTINVDGSKQSANGAQLVVDNVLQRPTTTLPWVRRADAGVEPVAIGGGFVNRCRDLDARGFGEETHSVVAERCSVFVSRRVVIE